MKLWQWNELLFFRNFIKNQNRSKKNHFCRNSNEKAKSQLILGSIWWNNFPRFDRHLILINYCEKSANWIETIIKMEFSFCFFWIIDSSILFRQFKKWIFFLVIFVRELDLLFRIKFRKLEMKAFRQKIGENKMRWQ